MESSYLCSDVLSSPNSSNSTSNFSSSLLKINSSYDTKKLSGLYTNDYHYSPKPNQNHPPYYNTLLLQKLDNELAKLELSSKSSQNNRSPLQYEMLPSISLPKINSTSDSDRKETSFIGLLPKIDTNKHKSHHKLNDTGLKNAKTAAFIVDLNRSNKNNHYNHKNGDKPDSPIHIVATPLMFSHEKIINNLNMDFNVPTLKKANKKKSIDIAEQSKAKISLEDIMNYNRCSETVAMPIDTNNCHPTNTSNGKANYLMILGTGSTNQSDSGYGTGNNEHLHRRVEHSHGRFRLKPINYKFNYKKNYSNSNFENLYNFSESIIIEKLAVPDTPIVQTKGVKRQKDQKIRI